MNNTDRLLELYNDLDALLRERYHDTSRTNSVILRYSNELNRSGNPNLIRIGKRLNMIRTLRNTIVHEFDNNRDNFVDISDEAVEFLQKVVDMLRNPKTAKDLYTPLSNLLVFHEDDEAKVLDVMKVMRQKGHSQVPVVNDHCVVKGVFSPNVLFAYLVNNPHSKIEDLSIKDILDYLPVGSHFSETYEFIPLNMSETDIDNLFSSSYERNRKLAVAFVTRTGNPKESLLGIIVAGDIIKDL